VNRLVGRALNKWRRQLAFHALRRLGLSLIFCLLVLPLVAMAAGATRERHRQWEAGSCQGWANAGSATTIEAISSAGESGFTEENSAVLRFVPSRIGALGLSTGGYDLICQGFAGKRLGTSETITTATIDISLAVRADTLASDVLIPAYSLDGGRTWTTSQALVLQGIMSNASHGGYWSIPLPDSLSREELSSLQFRLTYNSGDSFTPTTIFIDGVTVSVTTSQQGRQPLLEKFFSLFEQPVIIVDESTLDEVEFLTPEGQVVDLPFIQEVRDGQTRITVGSGAEIRAGTYIVRTKSKKMFRTKVDEQTVRFGVASMNTSRSAYEPGDLVDLAIGVLDDRGRTVCDARLTLTVTKPDGTTTTLSTSDGSIVGSAECGPESLTSQPDYLAHVLADQQGTFQTELSVATTDGPTTVRGQFLMEPLTPFRIERLAPTRINPKAPYVARLLITPSKEYQGVVQEVMPADFAVSNLQPTAATDVNNEYRTLEWTVDWQANQTYELAYTFNAPDISPALFTAGPLVIGDFTEPRQWIISSDEAIRKERADVDFASLNLDGDDWQEERNALATAAEPFYTSEETVHIKAFKEGFTVPDFAVPGGLDATKTVTVEEVKVTNVAGVETGIVHAAEDFRQGDQQLEVLHLVAGEGFVPGTYTVATTMTDGTNTVVEESGFTWASADREAPASDGAVHADQYYSADVQLDEAARGQVVTALDAVKEDFLPEEKPTFMLPPADDANRGDITNIELVNHHGHELPVPFVLKGDVAADIPRSVELTPETGYKPGRYTLEVDYETDNGEIVSDQQEFNWGVLVVNPEKSIYLPGDQASLGMAVLDYTGKTLCDADLILTVTDPAGAKTEFSTAGGTITQSYNCDVHSVTNVPDYGATYQTTVVGTYQLTLTSILKAGQARTGKDDTFTIEDSFEVREVVPFDISRANTPTRLYPVEDYQTTITITANEAYAGPIQEFLPRSFGVYDISSGGQLAGAEDAVLNAITWDVNWQAGETHTFTYWFDPPNLSPKLYPLGPFAIGDPSASPGQVFQESRQWQLAADATRVWDGGGTGANWSQAANWDTDTAVATNDTVLFDASAGGTPNDNSQWNAAAPQTFDSLTISSYSGSLTYNRDAGTITNAFSFTAAGAVTFQSGDTHTFGGNFTFTAGTMTTAGATQVLTGNGSTINCNKTFGGTLTIGDGSDTISVGTNSFTVNGTITTANASDTLSIGSGLSVTVADVSAPDAALTNNGTVSGAGTLIWQESSTLTTGGTISSRVRFDATSQASMTLPSRTFGGVVEVYNNSSSSARTVTLPATSITFSSDLNLMAENTQNVTLTGATNNPAVSIAGDLDFTGTNGTGAEIITSGSGTWTVTGSVDLRDGTYTASTNNTLLMDGTSETIIGNSQQFYKFTYDTSSDNGTLTANTSNWFVNNTMTIGTGDTLSISSGITVLHVGATLTLNGTISGAGELNYYSSSAFPSTGTISADLAYFAANNDQTVTARAYDGDLKFYHNSASDRTVTFAAGTVTVGGNLTFTELGTGAYTLTGAANNPTVDVAGFFAVGAGTPAVITGTGTWSFAAGANLTSAVMTFSAGHTLQLDGTGNFLSDSETMQNLTISAGTVTLANATHTVAGNLNLAGGTVTAGSSTVSMTGTGGKTITGGGNTLANLTIDPSSADTITLQTSDLTVSSTLTVAAGDTLSINSGIILTHTGATLTWGDSSSTIGGSSGILRFTSASGGPGTGGVISATTRYDATGADIGTTIFDARTYSGSIEIYSSSASSRSVRAAASTYLLSGSSSHFHVVAAGSSNSITFDGATNNPTMTIGGDLDFTGSGAASEIITSGTGTWTVSGNVDFSNGTFTATSGNTLKMDGTSKTITSNTNSLQTFQISGTVSVVDATTVATALTVDDSKAVTINSGITLTLSANSGTSLVLNTSGTVNGPGRVTYQNSATTFPTAGTLGSTLITRFDTLNGNLSIPNRTDFGAIEAFGDSANPRTVTLGTAGSQTITTASYFYLMAEASGLNSVTLQGASFDPTLNVGGDFDFTGVGTASEIVTAPDAAATWTVSGNVTLTDGTWTPSAETLAMGGTSKTFTPGGNSITNFTETGGTITMSGTTDINNNLTISGGTLTAPSALTIGGSFDNDAAFTHNSGTVTFDATSGTKTIDADGTGAEAFSALTFNDGGGSAQWDLGTTLDADGAVTIAGGTFNISSNNITVGGNWDNDDTFSFSSATVTFDAGSGTKTIDARGLAAPDFYNVTFNDGGGSATFQLESAMDVNNTLTITGGNLDTKSGSDFQINVGLSWVNADTFTAQQGTVVFDDAVFISAPVVDSTGATLDDFYNINFAGANDVLFTLESALDVNNNFTIGTDTEVDTKASEDNAINVGGNWDVDGYPTLQESTVTFDAASGTKTIDNSPQSGTYPFYHVTFNDGGGSATFQLTADADVNGNLTITGGTFDPNANAVNVAGNWDNDDTFTIGTGTVTFDAASGTKTIDARGLAAPDFYTVVFNDGGGSATFQLTSAFDANSAVTITGGTFDANGNAINVAGNWTNNDTFTHGSSTVTADGAAQQTFSGTMTGSSSFNNLTITNSSGSDPDTSPSVIFSAAATTASTFTATTASTKLRFNAGSTYTFQNIAFSGQATGTRVFLRSSSTGTQWNINVAGTRAVSYSDVKDSNACGQAPNIDASDGTNEDSGNNTCWTIRFITFSISDTAIGFGSLSATAARWATNDASGSASDTAAHTMSIAANGTGGYAISYNGITLTSGSNTIDAATITDSASGTAGTEQFALGFSTSGNATIASGYDHNAIAANRDWKFVPSTTTTVVSETGATATETISAFYLGNISGITEPGSYTTSITYIATATF